jgi:HprK-related kinase A
VTPAEKTIDMEVRVSKRSPFRPARYEIFGDGRRLFTSRRFNELLPYLEWGVNWRVIAARRDYLQIHAATLAHHDRAIVLAGPSGAGKSTLAAGLLARGWTYLSDEFALIDPATLRAYPFPKALCIKAGAFSTIERLNLPFWRRRHYVKVFKGDVGYVIPCNDDRSRPRVNGYPIRFVVFPRYADGEEPRFHPVSRAQAAFSLAGHSLNRKAFRGRAIAILSQVVRRAECLGLTSGPLDETCDLVETLFRNPRHHQSGNADPVCWTGRTTIGDDRIRTHDFRIAKQSPITGR